MTKKKNNNLTYIITIIIVWVVFSSIYFSNEIKSFLGYGDVEISDNTWKTNNSDEKEKLEITIIDDKRCVNCATQKLIWQLKQVPFLSTSIFTTKDFSDEWVEEMLIKNELTNLPAVILSNNNVDKDLKDTLITLKDGRYLVNELQAMFGSRNPHQMYINGKPGRFIFDVDSDLWHFEEGDFCQNVSCNSRVKTLLELIGKPLPER